MSVHTPSVVAQPLLRQHLLAAEALPKESAYKRYLISNCLGSDSWRRHFPETVSLISSQFLRGLNNFQAELTGAMENESDLLFTILRFVEFGPFVGVRLARCEESVEQTGELTSHRCNGFWRSQPCTQAAVLRSQVTLTTDQSGSGLAQGDLGPVDHFRGPSVQHFSPTGLVGGAQPQPIGEMLLAGKGTQIHAHLGNHTV